MSIINEQKLGRCWLIHAGSSHILREDWVLSKSEMIKVKFGFTDGWVLQFWCVTTETHLCEAHVTSVHIFLCLVIWPLIEWRNADSFLSTFLVYTCSTIEILGSFSKRSFRISPRRTWKKCEELDIDSTSKRKCSSHPLVATSNSVWVSNRELSSTWCRWNALQNGFLLAGCEPSQIKGLCKVESMLIMWISIMN